MSLLSFTQRALSSEVYCGRKHCGCSFKCQRMQHLLFMRATPRPHPVNGLSAEGMCAAHFPTLGALPNVAD